MRVRVSRLVFCLLLCLCGLACSFVVAVRSISSVRLLCLALLLLRGLVRLLFIVVCFVAQACSLLLLWLYCLACLSVYCVSLSGCRCGLLSVCCCGLLCCSGLLSACSFVNKFMLFGFLSSSVFARFYRCCLEITLRFVYEPRFRVLGYRLFFIKIGHVCG